MLIETYLIMGKDIITYQKRLELIDECLRKFEKPMNIKQIAKYCNDRLPRSFAERMYRYDIDKIAEDYDVDIDVEVNNGLRCYKYQDEDFSIKGETAVSSVDLLNFRKIKETLRDFLGLGLDTSLTAMTDEIDKFLGYDKNSQPVISFEKLTLESCGKLKPNEMLEPLLKAIIRHQTYNVEYMVPGRGKREWTVFPQFLKQYNQRWYLIATRHRDAVENKVYNLALDRILKMEPNQHIPYEESGIDFSDYFENVVGITKPDGAEPIEVKLRIDKGEYPYIESKPIHPSQDELLESDTDEKYAYVSLYVYNNYELRSKILSYGSKVTVMEPKSLRDKIAHELKKSLSNYGD